MALGIFLFLNSVSWAAEQGPEEPAAPTLWVPYCGGLSPCPRPPRLKAPLKQRERVPGLQNWKHRAQIRKGRMVLSPSPFSCSLAAQMTLA